jgi:hypothetical protein
MTFEEAKTLFNKDEVMALAADSDGRRFLLLRSLSRPEYLRALFAAAGQVPTQSGARALLEDAFGNAAISHEQIVRFIREINATERAIRVQGEPELVNQLYQMQAFDWGGLHKNSLEATIIDNYVKKITRFDILCNAIENELHASMRGYVQCSWYNHWTSIIIEDIFRDHAAVLPAIGRIKTVDLFVGSTPFDLKVTYLPEGFIKDERKAAGLRPELTLLKRSARKLGLPFEAGTPEAKLLADLWTKHRDHPSDRAKVLLAELKQVRERILADCRGDPTALIRWLYENQGTRRFDASNRLFLVLVDNVNFFESWKLKRAHPLLRQTICEYLDNVGQTPGRAVEFAWEGQHYEATADVIFIVSPQ